MFGHIMANVDALTEEEKERYGALYCGLCDKLKEKFGSSARMCLSYDLTFLVLLLSSLYEPEESSTVVRCFAHPTKKKRHTVNVYTDYAADMTVALTYFKALDDWQDDKKRSGHRMAKRLGSYYKAIKERYPTQCEAIERELALIGEIEGSEHPNPDAAANAFGRLMAELLVSKEDYWNAELRRIGYGLGRYIYMADAAIDLKEDIKNKNYNPLLILDKKPEEMRPYLAAMLGEASESLETLPLVQDIGILRNIFYSGIWIKYNQGVETERRRANGKRPS